MTPRPSLLLSLLLAPALHTQSGKGPPPPSQEALKSLASRAGSDITWIGDSWEHRDLARKNRALLPRIRNPEVDRGLLLDEALKRARAEGKPVMVYAFRIEGRHMYRAPLVDRYMQLALFSDPELAALIRRRFVPVRMRIGGGLADRLGIKNSDPEDPRFLAYVEPALVFLAPSGKVVHIVDRIRTFSVHWTRSLLKRVLAKISRLRKESALTRAMKAALKKGDDLAEVRLALQSISDGNEEAALSRLEAVLGRLGSRLSESGRTGKEGAKKKAPGRGGTPRRPRRRAGSDMRIFCEASLFRAKALRLLRRGREALACVEEALGRDFRDATLERAFRGELLLEKGRILVAMGRFPAAGKVLAKAPGGSERDFLLGATSFLQWEEEEAASHFLRSVQAAEAPFSWRSAAMLALSDDTTPISPLAHGYEFLPFGEEAIHEGLPRTSELERKGPRREVRKAMVAKAVSFLLSQQRPDGSWSDARYAYWPEPRILPNVRVAITALCATALLTHRGQDPERIDAALAKAEGYLRDDGRIAQGTEEEVYSQAYRILYFVRKAEALHGQREPSLFRNLGALVRRAGEIQDPKTGFFSHEYRNAFCTGAMMWSLYQAKKIGVEVSEDVIRAGVKALSSARREDGSFSYSGASRSRRGGSITSNLKNSSARMPVCESVLHVFGSSDPKKLARAFEVFLQYLDRLAKVRKCDFHSDGQLGGFFFWHAVFHSSEAKGLLGTSLRRKVEKALGSLLSSIPEIDGSFVDSHELGKSYGTAMALLVLGSLEE